MSNVLVVDNDRFILEFMKDILSAEGHTVVTAEDGLSAVDILEAYVPDIIFVDLIMPNIDGKRLCKIIRSMRRLDRAYLVILSATVSADASEIAALDVDACITKTSIEEMTQHVMAVIEQGREARLPCAADKIVGPEDSRQGTLTRELLSVKRHFETIFQKMSEGILEVTDKGRIVYANPAALAFIGLPEEEVLASCFFDLLAEGDRETVNRGCAGTSVSVGGRSNENPVQLNTYLLTLQRLMLDGNGKTIVIILNDITKIKEAEETLRRRNHELELLNLANRSFNSSLDLDQVLSTVLEELRRLIDVMGSTIWLRERESGQLVCRQAAGICSEILNGWRLEPHEGFAGWVAQNGKTLNVPDARMDDRHYRGVDSSTGVETRSILSVPLVAKGDLTGVLQVVDTAPGRFDESHQAFLEMLAASAAIAIENARLYEYANQKIQERKEAERDLSIGVDRLRKTLNATVESMALIVERRDPYTAGHQRRVAQLAVSIAEGLGLAEDQIEGIRMSAIIHDIGKMAIPTAILSKPGKLEPEEFALIQKHPWVGYDVLKQVEFPWPIAQIVYQHHEKMNGSGYPQGLSGNDILIESRILCVSDVVEAMASHRPYRAALGIREALDEINDKKGALYDTDVVNVCLQLFEKEGFVFK